MTYIIFKDGKPINRIVADEVFCAEHYSRNGYSYEMEAVSEPVPADPTEEEQLRADVDYIAAMTGVIL